MPKQEDRSDLFTMRLMGTNEALEADFNQDPSTHSMQGIGTNTRLSLKGSVPLQSSGAARADGESDITFILEDIVDANQAKGEITGTFDTTTGTDCKLTNTVVRFFR
jgi:hypothetical protein